jgi:hypothetical protein
MELIRLADNSIRRHLRSLATTLTDIVYDELEA